MTHTHIALSIWAALIIIFVLIFISAMGRLFGYTNVIGGLLAILVIYGGGFGLIVYTIWAFWTRS